MGKGLRTREKIGAIYPLQPHLDGMTAKNLKQNHQGCYFLNYNRLSYEEPTSGIRFVKYVGKLEKISLVEEKCKNVLQ